MATVAAVADALTQPEYVYLLRVEDTPAPLQPSAKIPNTELPAAAP